MEFNSKFDETNANWIINRICYLEIISIYFVKILKNLDPGNLPNDEFVWVIRVF